MPKAAPAHIAAERTEVAGDENFSALLGEC